MTSYESVRKLTLEVEVGIYLYSKCRVNYTVENVNNAVIKPLIELRDNVASYTEDELRLVESLIAKVAPSHMLFANSVLTDDYSLKPITKWLGEEYPITCYQFVVSMIYDIQITILPLLNRPASPQYTVTQIAFAFSMLMMHDEFKYYENEGRKSKEFNNEGHGVKWSEVKKQARKDIRLKDKYQLIESKNIETVSRALDWLIEFTPAVLTKQTIKFLRESY